MKILNLVFLILVSGIDYSQNSSSENINLHDDSFVGEWILDLRPSPDADPYLQSFTIIRQDEKKYSGIFYGSPVEKVYINKNWDKLYFAFKSSDSSNEYYQSGYIIGDKIYGTTFCPNRDFIMPWTGKKKEKR